MICGAIGKMRKKQLNVAVLIGRGFAFGVTHNLFLILATGSPTMVTRWK